MREKGFINVYSLVVLIIVVLVGIYLGQKYSDRSSQTPITPGSISTSSPAPIPTDANGWTIYTDQENGFSFHYPADWVIKKNTYIDSGRERVYPHVSPYFQSPDLVDSSEPTKLKGNYVVVSFNEANGTLDDYAKSWMEPPKLNAGSTGLVSVEKTTLNNQAALKIKTIGPVALLRYEMIRNGTQFDITCAYNPDDAASLAVCEKVTQTFQLL